MKREEEGGEEGEEKIHLPVGSESQQAKAVTFPLAFFIHGPLLESAAALGLLPLR